MTQRTPILFLLLFLVINYSYSQYNINYAGTPNIEVNNDTIIQVGLDNHIKIPIGFDFDFFGNNYDSLYVDFHGFVTFNDEAPFVCCEGQLLPNATAPNNLIAACWTDPSAGFDDGNGFFYNEYSYEVLGTAPYRRLIITFDFNAPCSSQYYGQIKLFETTNVIEIHTDQWNSSNDNCNNTTQGIENGDGTIALFNTNRNANTTWQAINDFTAFTPEEEVDLSVVQVGTSPVCSGNRNVGVYLFNNGSEIIDSFDLAWEWDNVYQDSQRYYATILPDNYYLLNLGNKTFGSLGEVHNIKAWSFNPNGVTDPNPTNDTLIGEVKVGLKGTFTIGGASPDYATINDAITALQTYGTCDSTIFNIRPGTYTEQLDFTYFPTQYTLFRAENGDSSSVIIQHSGAYTIRITNVFNLHFQNLTIRSTGIPTNGTIEIKNFSIWISIKNCLIESSPVHAGDISSAIYFFDHAGEIDIYNNKIKYGRYGIFMEDYNTNYRDNIEIINNDFLDQSKGGISTVRTNGLKVKNNRVKLSSLVEQGIKVSKDNAQVELMNNEIVLSGGAQDGIYLDNISGSNIYNNKVSLKSVPAVGTPVALMLGVNSNNSDVQYNSLLTYGSSNINSEVFHSEFGNIIHLKNNIFSNKSGGKLYIIQNQLPMDVRNNAVYSSVNNPMAIVVGNQYSSLATLQIAGYEQESKFKDVMFFSNENLNTIDPILNRAASPSNVVSDIQGKVRDLTHPDIGAHEFNGQNFQIAVESLTSPTSLSCLPNQDLVVVIKNNGEQDIDSFKIYYKAGSLDDSLRIYRSISVNDTIQINLGNLSLASNDSLEILVRTSLPNGVQDGYVFDDTLKVIHLQSYQGSLTIGGVNPTFKTIKQAFTNLAAHGICGPVTLNVRSGTYIEKIVADSIPGASQVNTITLQSEAMDSASVIIQYEGDNFNPNIMEFKNAKYLTIQHLKFINTSSFYGNGIFFKEKSNDITIKDCSFNSNTSSFFASGGSLLTFTVNNSNRHNSILIQGNTFNGGLQSIGCFSCQYLNILNNKITPLTTGINISNAIDFNIAHNLITKQGTFDGNGIKIQGSWGDSYIRENIIKVSGHSNGINFDGVNFSTQTGTTSVINNFIKTENLRGLRIWNSDNLKIYHNNINTIGTLANESYGIEIVNSDTLDIRNNIFKSNNQKVLRHSSNIINANVIDYNLYFNSSGNFASWQDVDQATFANWKTATGFDAHSYFANPNYVSNEDLHVLSNVIDAKAQVIPSITTDIDGAARHNTTPDIGADEVGTALVDAGILGILPKQKFKRGIQQIKAIIKNYGSNPLISTTIQWRINGVAQSSFSYNGNIPTLGIDTVVIGTYNFALNAATSIAMNTHLPNGVADPFLANDSLTVFNIFPAVSDTILISSSGPLPTIAAAVQAIQNGGVIDSVHFFIPNGSYHHSLAFNAHPNFSCNQKVIFESQSGNENDVIWDNVNINNSTLILNGADGLTFKNITIKAVGNTYGTAITIDNGADCNTFENCSIQSTGSTTTSSIVNSAGYSVDRKNTFKNCYFNSGYFGGSFVNDDSLTIDNCLFSGQKQYGIDINNVTNSFIIKNNFDLSSDNLYSSGIISTSSSDIIVSQNKINVNGPFASSGIRVRSVNNPYTFKINNNFIIHNGQNSFGIWAENNNNLKIFNNSILGGGLNSTSVYFNGVYAIGNELKYNVIYNKFTGNNRYILQIHNAQVPIISDYNDLYINDGIIGNNGTSNFNTLANWKTTGYDAHSISEDPVYTSNSDLHTTSSFLNGTALPVSGLNVDIDGDARDLINPDLGADEFTPVTHDVGILAINGPTMPFPSGNNYVYIKFQNNGIDTLTSMKVNWSVNGVLQSPYTWTGILPSAGTYDSLDIGQFNFVPYEVHNIKVWVGLPNGVADQLANNDTLYKSNLYPALNGTYTIGGSNPDFVFIHDAATALNNCGIVGNVTMNIRPGVYADTVRMFNILGTSCTKTVTFQNTGSNNSDVVINNLGFSYPTIQLDGSDGIRFKNLTIESVNPIHRRAVIYQSGASCNTFEGNKLRSLRASVNYDPTSAIVYSPNSQDTNNLFINNEFINGSTGLVDEGGAKNNELNGNIFSNQSYSGFNTSYGHSFHYKNNSTIKDGNYSYEGVRISNMNGASEISGNTFYLSNNRNEAINYIASGDPNIKSSIKNNFVSLKESTFYNQYGLVASGSSNLGIYNNSLRIEGNLNDNYYVNGIKVEGGNQIDLKNNIVSMLNKGYAIYTNGVTNLTSNYNDYYKSTAPLLHMNGIFNDLSSWRSAASQDLNSINQNPQFLGINDLHTHLPLLNGQGITIPSVTTDIDGDLRQSPPDIGADEFDPLPTNDAGIFMFAGPNAPFSHGSQNVKLVLKNFGGNNLTSVKIRWTINGVEQPLYNWSGNLGSAACDTFTIGNYNFLPYTSHQIISWTELPNNLADTTNLNDTIRIDNIYPALNGAYTLGGFLPNFNLFSQFQNALQYGGVLGPVTINVRNGNYVNNFSLDSFPGMHNNYSVKIKGESGNAENVHIATSSLYRNLFTLSGVHHIEFKNLSLDHPNEKGIELQENGHHITIDSCIFNGGQNFNSFGFYTPSTKETYVTIKNSKFNKGLYGVQSLSSWGAQEEGFVIQNNIFKDQLFDRLNLYHQNNVLIKGNTFQGTIGFTNSMVYLVDLGENSEISHNKLYCTSPIGIGMLIQYGGGASSSYNKFYNNYVYSNVSNEIQAVYFNSVANWNIDNNTIHVKNGQPLNLWTGYAGNQLNIRNNILKTEGSDVALWSAYPMHTSNILDYNSYHTNGSQLISLGNETYINMTDLRTSTVYEDHGYDIDPLVVSDGSPSIKQADLNGTGLPLAYITTDLDNTVRSNPPDIGAKEFTPIPNDVGITQILHPTDNCNLSDEKIEVVITNFGSNVVSGFNVRYKLDNNNYISQNIGSRTIQPGDTIHFSFSTLATFSTSGLHTLIAGTLLGGDSYLLNDTIIASINNIPSISTPPTNLIPLDNTPNTETTVSLSWLPAPQSSKYDLYYWNTNGSRANMPSQSNIAIINTSISGLSYGDSYYWQVVAKNECGQQLWSDTNKFTVRLLPDLVVDSIIAPLTGFSGQQIAIEYYIRNIGLGNTQSTSWTDNIYLSSDQTLNGFDFYLGSKVNLTALNPLQSYTNSQSITLPQGTNGNYFVIIKTDFYSNLIETNDNNNTKYKVIPISITLTPPPDLRVINVTGPSLSFSGQVVNFSYTVKNLGTGNTLSSNWKDRVAFKNHPSNNSNIYEVVKTIDHSGTLLPNGQYVLSNSFILPANISGLFQIEVSTDVFNDVYEFASDNNNTGISNDMNVILSVPADLIPDSILVPDSVHLYGDFTYSFHIKNKGGSVVPNAWSDRIVLSKSPIDNPNFYIQFGNIYSNAGLGTNSSKKYSFIANLANLNQNLFGDHYWYFIADHYNQVDEWIYEDNNTVRSIGKTFIKQPDLTLESTTIPAAEIAGTEMTFDYRLKNQGIGNYSYYSLSNRFYLSIDSVYNPSMDILLQEQYISNPQLPINDIDTFSASVILPPQYIGNYYIISVIDAYNNAFETNENNNVYISNKVLLYSGLSPDIEASNIAVPATAIAGKNLNFSYSIQNNGDIDIKSPFTDSIFISFSTVWNRSNATFLGIQQINQLDTEQVLNINLSLLTSINQTSNVYYLYVISDAKGQIFEGTLGEANNVKRSNGFTIQPYPPIDIRVLSFTGLPDTMTFGLSYPMNYSIKNQGMDQTFYSSWIDKLYLSTDSLFDQNDLEIRTLEYTQGNINKDSIKNISASIILPNGLLGDYYLILNCDANNKNNDINLTNNIIPRRQGNVAKKIHIKQGLYPDIIPTNLSIPITVTAGLYFDAIVSTTNQGQFNAGSRNDKLFISTDPIVNIGDRELEDKNHTQLNIGVVKKDTFKVFIPANYQGNYFIIFSADHNNSIYEYGNEGNNIVIASIEVLAPPPSDLKIKDVVVPISVLAGKKDTIEWTTTNIGANPAIANMREIIYLSQDTTWDLNDEVLGIKDYNIYIPPSGQLKNAYQATYNNVSNGDYHTIIRTDARNNVLESNEDNNETASIDITNIDIEEIYVERLKTDNVAINENNYYKIKINAEEAGRNLLVTLKGDSIYGQTEMYIKYGRVPTEADNDLAYSQPYKPNQEILVKKIVPGYYYILVKGRMSNSVALQNITILPEIKRMYISDFNPKKGSNKGWVTMIIEGSELDSLETVELVLNDTSKYYAIQADTFIQLNEGGKVLARFNLQDKLLGWYDLQCVRPDGFMARRKSSFEIINGALPQLAVSWNFTPNSFHGSRAGLDLCQITVSIENLGDNDLGNHTVRVGAPQGENQMYYTQNDNFNNNHYEILILKAEDEGGLPGILKPRGRRVFNVYGKWTGYQGFTVGY
jgi:hypothetical protein